MPGGIAALCRGHFVSITQCISPAALPAGRQATAVEWTYETASCQKLIEKRSICANMKFEGSGKEYENIIDLAYKRPPR
jgi:hypothetical protein